MGEAFFMENGILKLFHTTWQYLTKILSGSLKRFYPVIIYLFKFGNGDPEQSVKSDQS